MEKLKTFVKKNGKKIVVGTGVVIVTGVACYLGYKNIKLTGTIDKLHDQVYKLSMNNKDLNEAVGQLGSDNKELCETVTKLVFDNETLSYEKDTLMAAASEGLFEEAIATVTRKMNTAIDRMASIKEQIKVRPNDADLLEALDTYSSRVCVFSDRKRSFMDAQKTYELNIE